MKSAVLGLTIVVFCVLNVVVAIDAEAQNPNNLSVLIRFNNPPGQAEADLIQGVGGQITHSYHIVSAVAASIPPQAVRALLQNPNVSGIEADYRLYLDVSPNDLNFSLLWGLHNTGQSGGTADADIDAPEAWDITTGSPSTLIAVIDTGIQIAPGFGGGIPTHPDLEQNIWTNPGEIAGNLIDDDGNGYVDDIHGWNFYDNASWLIYNQFEDFHGTHVAGIIAAAGNNSAGVVGVNWQADIMSLKFIGPGGFGTTSAAIAAIEYATDKGAQIINASWGGGEYSQTLKDAIDACNCLFVAAAGNGGEDQIGDDTDIIPHYPSAYISDNIISVAATDRNDDRASFSNFGAASVDLGAPGVDIMSTFPLNMYDFLSGTSMAAPHVAGVAGLVLSQTPGLTVAQVKEQIIGTTDPVTALNGITLTGGRLNALAALTDTPTPPPPPPPPPGGIPDVADADVATLLGTRSGSFLDTQQQDDVYESLLEKHSGGKPSNRHDRAEHVWSIPVSGANHIFNLDAHHTDAGDADTGFLFEWSTSSSGPWTSMLTVTKTADDDTYQTFDLGAPSGTIFIRATDDDRTAGQNSNDTLFVDHMFLDGGAPDPVPPGPATNPNPADDSTDVSVTPVLSWSAGSGAGAHDVYFGTNPTPGLAEFVSRIGATSFAPGTLAELTTYYWRVDEVNLDGTTAGPVWSFTTGVAPPPPPGIHVDSITLQTIDIGLGNRIGLASVRILDDLGNPVPDVIVFGTFTGTFEDSGAGITGVDGFAAVATAINVKDIVIGQFCVDDALDINLVLIYNPADNVETCDTF